MYHHGTKVLTLIHFYIKKKHSLIFMVINSEFHIISPFIKNKLSTHFNLPLSLKLRRKPRTLRPLKAIFGLIFLHQTTNSFVNNNTVHH